MLLLIIGEAVPAHCCILSACSPFFTERLEREMPPKGHKVVLEIRGLKIGTLRKLVDFLYTSEMEVSREEAQDILAAARQLQVSELESLQLEGGKLVKKSLGPRLNRGCLQVSSPISIPEAGLIGSSTAGDRNSSVTGKQHTAVKRSCTRMVDHENRSEQNEIKKQKPVALSHDDTSQASKGPMATTEALRKAKKRPSSAVRSILGNAESGALHIEEAATVQKEPAVSLKASKKIKLRRSKLSSPSSAVLGVTKDHCAMMSSELSRSSRRLWRQKSKEEANNARESSHFPSFWSPPLLQKPNKGRRRNLSEPALSTEAGQIGRVKLRKVINGSCWEVVQESPSATQPARAANSACTLKNEVTQPQLKCPQSVVDAQHSADSARLLPAEHVPACYSEESLVKKTELSKVVSEEGESAVHSSYELSMFMTDHVAEGEQYDSLASEGELEHLLDFFLADDDDDNDAIGESQVPAVPEGMPMACLAQGGNKSPGGRTGAEEKERHPAEMSVAPQVVESEKRLLQREQEAPVLEIHKEMHGSLDGRPLLDPVLGSPLLTTNESTSDCLTLCRSASLNDSTEPKHQSSVLENGATQLTETLPVTLTCDEDQGLLSYEVGFLGTETTPYSQVMLKSPLQCNVDYKLPSVLTSFEEEELDVGGIEELFISSNCVRPDPSPEIEVDVLS